MLSLFLDRYQSIKLSGDGYTWATFYYLLTFVKGVMLFSVILLIGTGWSFLKPFLQDRYARLHFSPLFPISRC